MCILATEFVQLTSTPTKEYVMKYVVAPLAALVLMVAAAAQAAPFQSKDIAADSKWVIHVDVDAIRDNYIVKKAFETCPQLKDAGKHFDKIREKIGIDLRKDLHGITLYGPDADHKHAVAIVYAAVDQKLLLEKAEKASDHKVRKHGDVEIHSWSMKHGSKSDTAAGAFYKNDALVFAANAEGVGKAIDVMDGSAKGITELGSPLGGRAIPGATVIIRAFDFPSDEHCAILKQAKSIRVAMGENNGKSFYRVRMIMKNSESAEQIKTIADGFKAMASLRFSGEADMMKMVNGLKATVTDGTLNVRWEAPVEDVWAAARKWRRRPRSTLRRLKEMHKKQAPKGGNDDGPIRCVPRLGLPARVRKYIRNVWRGDRKGRPAVFLGRGSRSWMLSSRGASVDSRRKRSRALPT